MTTTRKRRSGDARQNIVDAILAARVTSQSLSKKADLKRFLGQYFVAVPYEDLEGRSETVMAQIAVDHLDFAATRKRGQALIRIYNANQKEHGYSSDYTFVEMVNDDMPFLVDSVAAAINRHNLAVHITVHPIISVKRDSKGKLQGVASHGSKHASRESFIRFAITRETDPQELKTLRREILKVLADIRVAFRDWHTMRERMSEARDQLEYGPKGADPVLRAESQALLDWMVNDHFTFLGYREYRLARRGKGTFGKCPWNRPRSAQPRRHAQDVGAADAGNATPGDGARLADTDEGKFPLHGSPIGVS